MSQERKLEPCPFCGNEAHFVDDLIIVYASCTNCGATGAHSSYKSGAAYAWNHRAALSATQPGQAKQGEPVVPPELDVRRIMLDIVPGDGDGLEVYAETVDDVVATLTEMGERIEDLEGAQTAAVAQGEPVKPLFASKVAARKWAELQDGGARMQSISFDGGKGGAGTIDPWGVVRWGQAAQGAGEVVADEFFAYHPEMGVEFFKTQREAVACTRENLDYEREGAIDQGEWDDSAAERTCWGVVVQRAKAVQSGMSDEGVAQFDYVLADTQPAAGADVLDAKRWRYAMDWDTKDFAVCRRVGATGTCWEPIKTDGPIDAAIAASGRHE